MVTTGFTDFRQIKKAAFPRDFATHWPVKKDFRSANGARSQFSAARKSIKKKKKLVPCYGTRYIGCINAPRAMILDLRRIHLFTVRDMIESFKHKGLRELFETGKTKKLPAEHLKKIKPLLDFVDAAHSSEDFNLPGGRLHKLKAPPYTGFYSLDVNGNYRLIFKFENGIALDVNYIDTH